MSSEDDDNKQEGQTRQEGQYQSDCMDGESEAATNAQLAAAGLPTTDELEALADAAGFTQTADVFIQAGHFNHNSWDGNTGTTGPLGSEINWTPIVTNEAVRILREAGLSVIKEDASIKGSTRKYRVKLAVFIHFDGSANSSAGGSSVGYKDSTDRPAAQVWKGIYANYWPFQFRSDNYTASLRGYYGYQHTSTQDAEMVIELGMLTNLAEAEWLKPRLKWLGSLVAHFMSTRTGLGGVPDPGPFQG